MQHLTSELLIEVVYALGIGLFVGLEREHHELGHSDEEPTEQSQQSEPAGAALGVAMGVRTFTLLSLLGWAVAYMGPTFPWVPPAALVVVGALVVTQYYATRLSQSGMTTEVAAVMVFVTGMLVHVHRPLAVVLALGTTLLLLSKPWFRSLVPKIKRVELSATLQLAILLAIVLPELPSEPMDPWNALPPRKIGLFIILIAGISYVGYFASRVLGARRGAWVTGLVGGLTSSTAVTVAMSQVGRADETMRVPGQLAVFVANAMMFARVLVVSAVLSRDVAIALAAPMSAMGLVMLGGALWKWKVSRDAEEDVTAPPEPELTNPFALIPALKWGILLCGVLLLAVFAQNAFGDKGLLAAAAASGLADVDAITLAVCKSAAEGTLAVGTASLAIAIAVVSNTVVKGGMALFIGRTQFGGDIAKVFGASIALGLGAAVTIAVW